MLPHIFIYNMIHKLTTYILEHVCNVYPFVTNLLTSQIRYIDTIVYQLSFFLVLTPVHVPFVTLLTSQSTLPSCTSAGTVCIPVPSTW